MSRVDFYHLQNQTLADVLPKLLEKAYGTKQNIIVKIGDIEKIEEINNSLWTYDADSFLPHGSKKDGSAGMQPIWLTSEDENLNQAKMIFLVEGAVLNNDNLQNFDRVLNIFNGNSEAALSQAREFWKELKSNSHECFYWQQDDMNRWKQK